MDKFVGQKLTKWNDELIMQFYSTALFYPDGRIVWMSEGTRYQSTVDEWARLINAPAAHEDDLDVYAKKKKTTTQWQVCTRKFLMMPWKLTSWAQ